MTVSKSRTPSQLDYYEFMGFGAEALRQRYATYADRFLAGSCVLDLGCGRGEFLELLAARGVRGLGIDTDEAMVGAVKAKGFEAFAADAVGYLEEHPNSCDGIFAAHLVEHMPPEGVRSLARAAAGALQPGGRLILVTPNPHNLQVQLHDFWIDLQHLRFYSPDILRWIVHDVGLREIEVGENDLYRSGPALPSSRLPELPGSGSPAQPPTLRRRALNKAVRMVPAMRRLAALEERANQLTGWMQSLYPPAEYFVTAVR